MGFMRKTWDWLTLADVPTYRFSEPEPRPIDQVILSLADGVSGKPISRAAALSVPAVLRGRNLIASVSTLPLRAYGADDRPIRRRLFDQIDPDVANIVTIAQTAEDLLFESIAWWEILEFEGGDIERFPIAARHIPHTSVSLVPRDGRKGRSDALLPSQLDPRDCDVYVDGEKFDQRRLIRFDSPNPALLRAGARPLRRALLITKMGELYADGGRPLDYFTPADNADPVDDDEVRDILDTWHRARKERTTAYVPAALSYNAVDVMSPSDLQLVDLERNANLGVANAIGLDPEDLGISTTSRTYQNATDRRQDRVNDVYSPYMLAISQRLSMGDVTPRGQSVRFDLDDYMRADPITRSTYFKTMKEIDVLTPDEIRDRERIPGNAPKPKPQPAQPAAPGGNVVPIRQTNSAASFADAPHQFADVPVTGFSVDVESRIIRGRALPYGETARKAFAEYEFLPGSLQWSETSRVKLLRDHTYSAAIGKAVELVDADGGFDVAFKVARGPEGDVALSLAEDGVLDGFSVGVDFDPHVDADRVDGRYVVRRATLREVSLTAMPAFDSARVTRVAASRDEGGDMPEDKPDTTGPATPGLVALTAEQFTALIGQRGEGEGDGKREFVNATRRAEVTEPAPYRFGADGTLMAGSHDFSKDLFAASKGDRAAEDRATSWMKAQFDVDKADAATLNPNRNRQDMYVDQRQYRYPVWEAINKGTLADITPFVFPKFNTSSGLVAAHTEGVEPTPGTFTATSQTVTPAAVSGKVEITREAWDQGGNPQLSGLIWRQMTRAWYEALEAKAIAVLDAATPTALATFTAGGGTNKATLVAELTAGLAGLQFVRGGFSMDNLFAQIDLYKDLIAAKDSNGRPIYPALGPTNALGTVATRFGAIEVAPGVTAYPSWALAATGSVAASSYLFDSESVHGWASAPQRLDFQYRVAYVDLAIWGYTATAISDINGVREITYDPVA